MSKTKTHSEKSKQTTQQASPKKMTKKAIKMAKSSGHKGGAALMGGAAGAVVGAAIGGVAGAALADEKTRKNVGTTLNKVSKAAVKATEQAQMLSESANDASLTTRQMVKDSAVDIVNRGDKTKS